MRYACCVRMYMLYAHGAWLFPHQASPYLGFELVPRGVGSMEENVLLHGPIARSLATSKAGDFG